MFFCAFGTFQQMVQSINFTYGLRTITPHSASAVMVLSSVCSQVFNAGMPTDLAVEGCERLGFAPLSDCPIRYDIVSVMEGVMIQFG